MPQVTAPDGARIHYEVRGRGPLLLLVHGGTGTGGYDWQFQEPLAERFRLLVPDLRGHGRSTDPAARLDLDSIAEDMLALVEEVGEAPAAVVGFSIGGTAMLRLMTRRPGLARAFAGIGVSYRGDPSRVEAITSGGWPAELRDLRHEASPDPEHWRVLRSRLARTWADSLRLEPEDLGRVEIPALFCCGDRDPIEPVETAAWLARALPLGELLVVPRAGHFAQRDRPAVVNAALVDFLGRALA